MVQIFPAEVQVNDIQHIKYELYCFDLLDPLQISYSQQRRYNLITLLSVQCVHLYNKVIIQLYMKLDINDVSSNKTY